MVQLGDCFPTKEEGMKAIQSFCLQGKLPRYVKKSDSERYVLVCPSRKHPNAISPCPFNITIFKNEKNGDFYVTKMLPTHAEGCQEKFRPGKLNVLDDAMALLEQNENASAYDLMNRYQQDYGVQLNYNNAHRILATIRKEGRQHTIRSVSIMGTYLDSLGTVNPDTAVEVQKWPDNTVKRAFLSFGVLGNAFANCKKVAMVNLAPLHSKPGGVIMGLTAQDGAGNNIVLAIGFAESETESSWEWFLEDSEAALPGLNAPGVTVMHDRGKFFTSACKNKLPLAVQSMCFSYLVKLMKEKVKMDKKEVELLRAAARACNEEDFKRAMDNLRKSHDPLYEALCQIDPKLWALSHSPVPRYGIIATDEGPDSFSAIMSDVSDKTPLVIFTGYVWNIGALLWSRQMKYASMPGTVPKEVTDKYRELAEQGIMQGSAQMSENVFISRGSKGEQFVVNLDQKVCTCGEYQLTGFPCSHVAAAMKKRNIPLETFVEAPYLLNSLKAIYAHTITPVPCNVNLEPPEPESPPKSRGTKDKKKRKRDPTPEADQYRCSRCGKKGHTIRKCPLVTGLGPSSSAVAAIAPSVDKPSFDMDGM